MGVFLGWDGWSYGVVVGEKKEGEGGRRGLEVGEGNLIA